MTNSTWSWLATFALSPGFGGAAAVGAALIALAAARMTSRRHAEQSSADRAQRADADARSQWWSRFAWAAERLGTADTVQAEIASATFVEVIDHTSGSVDRDLAAAVSSVVPPQRDDDLPPDDDDTYLDEGGIR